MLTFVCLQDDYIDSLVAARDDGIYYYYDGDESMVDYEPGLGASGGDGISTVKPRQYFPETWLWQSAEAG